MRALHPLPEGRYEGALEMGDALKDGLRGVAPEPTDATVALDSTSATRMMGETMPTGTSSRPAQRTRRPLEPIDEPPRRRPSSPPAREAVPARKRAQPRQRRNPLRGLVALVLLLAVVVAGVLAYQALQDGSNQAVQLKERIHGDVQQAVDEVKGLIEDNTR
jgi:hypothetical protein